MSLPNVRAARRPGERLSDVERRWFRNFSRSHEDRKFSLCAAKVWIDQLARCREGMIDALVGRKDGTAQRGTRIPAKQLQMFKDEYYRSHRPNLALIYGNVVAVAEEDGWGAVPSYDSFWREAQRFPKLAEERLRESRDANLAESAATQHRPADL